jgi:ubiquitin-protein ligase
MFFPRYVFQCYLNVHITLLCFSVLFERWCNVAMFFSVIWTLMQRHYVFQHHFNVRTLNNITTLYKRWNNTENHNDVVSTLKWHWKTLRCCINVQRTLKNITTLYQRSVDTTSLCFSVLFERWYNVTMFFSVISKLIQRRYVFQCCLNVDTTSLCFSVLFQRWYNVAMFFSVISTFMQRLKNITTLYQCSNSTEKQNDVA